ncbi:MAG TPA: hypothetical protein VJH71_00140 [Candidatus Paceibacterota bacterium]
MQIARNRKGILEMAASRLLLESAKDSFDEVDCLYAISDARQIRKKNNPSIISGVNPKIKIIKKACTIPTIAATKLNNPSILTVLMNL